MKNKQIQERQDKNTRWAQLWVVIT
jgi:hypothetical protein